jgi:hypothetical protein
VNKQPFHLFFLLIAGILSSVTSSAQILTSSPYSRYGMGELNLPTFATSSAMGGSFIAYHLDSLTTPLFINAANPAGLSGLRFATLELGGQAQFTKISNLSTSINKRNLNFSYASLGFPLGKAGGAAFGIMPYSSVGYNINSAEEVTNVGTMTYRFDGEGGLNKAFLATGLRPFRKSLTKFYNSNYHDTLVKYRETAKIKRIKAGRELLSELSVGVSGAYLFGTINQTTRVVYPGSITYFNSKRERSTQVNDFVFNLGLQTHFTIDSVMYHGKDTLKQGHRKILKEKVKIGFGFFAGIPSGVSAKQSNIIYTYALDAVGNEAPKDTVLNSQNVHGSIQLPLEMGIGFSVKKGEKLTVLVDAATTNWSAYKAFGEGSGNFKNSYRLSTGLNYMPDGTAFNSYVKRIQYRIGVGYTNGYLDLKNTSIANYYVTAGLGFPVGLGRSYDRAVVNVTAQFGTLGTISNNLLQEQYARIIIGFTFNNRWFIRPKYD